MERQLRMVARLRIDGAHASAGELGCSAERGARGHADVHAISISRCASAVGRPAAGGVAAPASAARRVAARTLAAAHGAAARAAVLSLRTLVVALALGLAVTLSSVTSAGAEPLQPGSELTVAGEIGAGQFGGSVALSTDGDTALVGAPLDAEGVGAAWVFTRSGSAWAQQEQLPVPEEAGERGHFGSSVALSADGDTAFVGAQGQRKGAVWVYTRTGSGWTPQAELTPSTDAINAFFGHSVAVSANGETAVISAPLDNGGVGAVWVFTRTGSSWTEQAVLTGHGESGDAHFGRSVAVSADGDTTIVGGRLDGGGVGAAWVFSRSGSVWTQDGPKLTGSEEEGNAQFGYSVALSPEGETALIGGAKDDGGTGAAWVFARSETSWTQDGAKLAGEAASHERRFGSSVALSANGSVALIGDAAADRKVGGAWEFARTGSEWQREGIFLTPGEQPASEEEQEEVGEARFGRSVALSGDGETALLGGPRANEDIGAAWIFEGVPVQKEVPPEESPEETGSEKGKTGGKRNENGGKTGNGGGTSPSQESPPSQTPQTPKTEVLASKTLQPALAVASCKLLGSHLTASHTGRISIKLLCSGNHNASGKLTLTVTKHIKRKAAGKGAQARTKTITETITIATVNFATAPNKTAVATLRLNKTGRSLLGTDHGRLTAVARLARLSPKPTQTHTTTVQLALQKPAPKKTSKH